MCIRDRADAPWQFTLFERNGSTVVVDDVHNASALRPLITAIDQFPSSTRAAVYSAGADRRDAEMCIRDRDVERHAQQHQRVDRGRQDLEARVAVSAHQVGGLAARADRDQRQQQRDRCLLYTSRCV